VQDLSPGPAVSIVLVVALAIAASILVLRDRWRDKIGMPLAERERQVRALERRVTRFFAVVQIITGSWYFAEFVRGQRTSRGGSYAGWALLLLISGYITWRGSRPSEENINRHH